jgi:hypothetical protein
VRYAGDSGYSFELPDDWKRLPNLLDLNFECRGSHIQVEVRPIRPEFTRRERRAEFLSEPGSKIVEGMELGGEPNSVMLVNASTRQGAISAVRGNVHYFVEFTDATSDHVQTAIERLASTFHFPSRFRMFR